MTPRRDDAEEGAQEPSTPPSSALDCLELVFLGLWRGRWSLAEWALMIGSVSHVPLAGVHSAL